MSDTSWINVGAQTERPGMGQGMGRGMGKGRMRLREKLGPGWRAKMGVCPFADLPSEELKEKPEFGEQCKALRDAADKFMHHYDDMVKAKLEGKQESAETLRAELNEYYDEMAKIIEQIEQSEKHETTGENK